MEQLALRLTENANAREGTPGGVRCAVAHNLHYKYTPTRCPGQAPAPALRDMDPTGYLAQRKAFLLEQAAAYQGRGPA